MIFSLPNQIEVWDTIMSYHYVCDDWNYFNRHVHVFKWSQILGIPVVRGRNKGKNIDTSRCPWGHVILPENCGKCFGMKGQYLGLWFVSWEPQRGEGTSIRDPSSEGGELRSGSVRQDGRQWGNKSITWRGHFCGIWKGRHWRMSALHPQDSWGCVLPLPLQHRAAEYGPPLLLMALPGLFSAPSQFPHLYLIIVQYLVRPILAILRASLRQEMH